MAALFALFAFPVVAFAQSAAPARLAVGTWTGKIVTPGNHEPTDLTYEVEYKADSLAITMVAGQEGKFTLNEIVVSDTRITFSFTPGPKVKCVLNSKTTGYAGECVDDDGNVVPLTMVPPAREPKS
jgi:hypothetical protein